MASDDVIYCSLRKMLRKTLQKKQCRKLCHSIYWNLLLHFSIKRSTNVMSTNLMSLVELMTFHLFLPNQRWVGA